MTQIYGNYVEIWGCDTLTGTKVAIAEKTNATKIQWDKPYTEYNISGANQYLYYFVRFSDGAVTPVVGEYSDGVVRTGLSDKTAQKMIQEGVDLVDEEINENGKITTDFLLRQLNEWQRDIISRRNWSFEIVDEQTITSLTLVNKYAVSGLTYILKHPNSNKSIIALRFGDTPLKKMDWLEYLDKMEGTAYTEVATAITAGDTSCILDDTYEFSESGSFFVGSDVVNYTTNTEASATLSGISASGTGAFTSDHVVDAPVWQGVSPGKPTKFVVYNDNFYFNYPVKSTYAGIKFKVSYFKEISDLADLTNETDVPFYYTSQYWLASRIEAKKGNLNESNNWMAIYENKIQNEIKKDRVPVEKKFVPVSGFNEIEGKIKIYRTTESSRYNNYP